MKTPTFYKDKKSEALISAIIVLALALAVVVAMHLRSRSYQDTVKLQLDTDKAYFLAKSGVGIAESFRAENPISSMDETYNLGGREVVKIEVDTTLNTITSTGRVGKSVRVLKKTFDSPLVAYWKFEGDARDETGKNDGELYAWLDLNSDGVNEAGPSDLPEFVANGVKGKAIKLKRLVNLWSCRHNNGVKVPDSPSLGIKEGITLCAWLNHEAGDPYGIYGYGKIITKSYFKGLTNPWELYSLDITSSTKARFIFTDGIAGGHAGSASSSTISEGVWYHFAGTYNGKIARFYVNGELVSENDISPDFLMGVNNEPVFIGGVENSPFHMYGLIDEVMIFNKALSQSEIKNIYDTQKP